MTPVSLTVHQPDVPSGPERIEALHRVSEKLEAAFLTEMLKSAGLAESRSSFGGGSGEDHFSSFLVRAQAEQIAKTGGIGLAESLFNALLEAENDNGITASTD
jgi:Rod binding domain-containing protein